MRKIICLSLSLSVILIEIPGYFLRYFLITMPTISYCCNWISSLGIIAITLNAFLRGPTMTNTNNYTIHEPIIPRLMLKA